MLNRIISRLLRIHTYKKVTFFLHTIVTSMYIGCCVYSGIFIWMSDNDYVLQKFIRNGKETLKYLLSIWAMAAETLFFCSYSMIDALEIFHLFYKKLEIAQLLCRFLKNIVPYVLFSIVFPLAVVVSILFWGFYFWDRELIYPKIMDDVLPTFMNHMMHTYPLPLSILYMFIEIKDEPPKPKALVVLSITMFMYTSLFIYANYNCDRWIYPALDALPPSLAMWIIILTIITPFMFLYVGYYVHSKIKDLRTYFNEKLKELMSHEKR